MEKVRVLLALLSIYSKCADGFIFLPSGNRLNSYYVDRSQISVSGISSGAAMASQIHVIYSKDIMGVGMIAGTPFACSAGNAALAISVCMSTPSAISATALELTTEAGAKVGNIDATSNMANDKVFIFDGLADSVVNPRIGRVSQAFYEHFIRDHSNVITVFDINAEHCMPTDNYGGVCDQPSKSTHYLSNCNYSAAFHLLNHIYGGNLQMPTKNTQQNGKLMKFSQSDFFYVTTPGMYSMDTIGYIYVPSGCLDKSVRCRSNGFVDSECPLCTRCKLHVAFHGCEMGQSAIGDAFVRHGGYNEVGELNNIIILYPQAKASTLPLNIAGCWDWWGYTGTLFATNSGFQPTAIKRMIDRVAG